MDRHREGGHRRSRQRRNGDRQGPGRQRSRRPSHREGPRPCRAPALHPGGDLGRRRRRARSTLSTHAAGMAQVDVAVAATGDDEDNLVISLLANRNSRYPEWWPGSTIPVINGCSTSRGEWTSRFRRRKLLTALVEERGVCRVARPAPAIRTRQRPPGGGDTRRGLRLRRGPLWWTSSFLGMPRWWPWSAETDSSSRGATRCSTGRRSHGARHRGGGEGGPTTAGG